MRLYRAEGGRPEAVAIATASFPGAGSLRLRVRLV